MFQGGNWARGKLANISLTLASPGCISCMWHSFHVQIFHPFELWHFWQFQRRCLLSVNCSLLYKKDDASNCCLRHSYLHHMKCNLWFNFISHIAWYSSGVSRKLLLCCLLKFQDCAGSERAHWVAAYKQAVIILCKALQLER